VQVHWETQRNEVFDFEFRLNEDELAGLTALVEAVKFFDLARPSTPLVEDAGHSSLAVRIGERYRKFDFGSCPDFAPLEEAIHKLINQGIVTQGLQTKTDVAQAAAACSPLFAGRKVYCPRLLVAPLKQFVAECADIQRMQSVLAGLAWVLSEQEWVGFTSSQVAKASGDRQAIILIVLSSSGLCGSIPEPHAKALLPLLAHQLDVHTHSPKPITAQMDQALDGIIGRIEALRYDRAVPLLKDIVKVQGTSSCGRRAASTLKAMERRKQADAGAPEQTQGESLTAEQARQAVLALIRSRPKVFVGAPDPDRLAKLPLKERGDGEYSFGAFVVNLPKRWYAAHVGGDDQLRDAWSYNGSFVRRDGQWIATEPKVTELHQPPKKVTETPQPPK
jgi:hypothetical protein